MHSRTMRLAVIGDIHGQWNEHDVAFFNASDVDGLLFVGDLAGLPGRDTLRVARLLTGLERPFAVIPGNHDCGSLLALGGEFFGRDLPGPVSTRPLVKLWQAMQGLLGERLLGYSSLDLGEVRVVGARPWAMEGNRLSFGKAVKKLFGIETHHESAAAIRRLVSTGDKPVIVLAHNGPRGLGSLPHDMFGVDFRSEGGDNGDPDLTRALDGADGVVLVAAGHMHHAWRGGNGALRTFVLEAHGRLYLNAARVPRRRDGRACCMVVDLERGRPVRVIERWYPYGRGVADDQVVWAASSSAQG